MANAATQKVSLNVGAGLFVLRYLGGPDARTAPRAFVKPGVGSNSDIDIINAPGCATGDMSGPGSNIVLVARRAGSIDVVIEAVEGSSNSEVKFSLDLLAAAQQPTRLPQAFDAVSRPSHSSALAEDNASSGRATISLAAHVSRRGDISADSNGWIAGPQAPSAVEGLEIKSLGADVGVAAQYTNTLDRHQWSAWQTPGSLIGTRQKASPLTGLRLKIVGSDASRFELEGEALFLGAPVIAKRGFEIEFTSPAGTDPLVGLRLTLVEKNSAVAESVTAKTSRVRVFR